MIRTKIIQVILNLMFCSAMMNGLNQLITDSAVKFPLIFGILCFALSINSMQMTIIDQIDNSQKNEKQKKSNTTKS